MIHRNGTLTLTRRFNATPEQLFNAWIDEKQIGRWWLHVQRAAFDPRPDGQRVITFKLSNGTHAQQGVHRVVEPFSKIVFTWHPKLINQSNGAESYETTVTLKFTPISAGVTELTLTHEGLKDSALRTDHHGGWLHCLDCLSHTYETSANGADVEPLLLTRVFKHGVKDVYRALTDTASALRWYHSGPGWKTPHAFIEPRDGGRFRVDMENEAGDIYPHHGQFLDVRENFYLVHTWHSDAIPGRSVVSMKLRELGERETELSLCHAGLGTQANRDNHAEGWRGCLDRLGEFLA